MEEALTRMSEAVQDPANWLVKWKETNKRPVIGCVPMFVPEEIVHAAGALPAVLWEGAEPITLGHSRIQIFFSGIVRSLVDQLMKRQLDFLDGVIVPDICIPMKGLLDVIKLNSSIPFQFSLYLPKDDTKTYARDYLVEQLARMRTELSQFTGKQISDGDLRQSIQVFNKNRALLRRLYELRRQKPGAIKSSEIATIVAAATIMPKEEHSTLLEALLPQLEARPAAGAAGARLILSGCLCEWPKTDILDLIEEVGGVVVDDEMYTGRRYFATDVGVNGGPPITALADAYMKMAIPNPVGMDPTNRWGDYLVKLAREAQAQAVIHIMVKYCEPHGLFYPDLATKLNEAGIPHFLLEIEHEVVSWGQFKTRLQAFLETIRRKR